MRMSIKKYLKAILNIGIALVILLLAVFLLPKMLVFFLPFVIGWIIAWIAGPPVHFLEKKLKIRRKISSAATIIIVIGLVVLVGYLIISKLIQELGGFIQDLPDLWSSIEEDFNNIAVTLSGLYDKLPVNVQNTLTNMGDRISEFAGDMIGKLSSPTIEAVGNFAKQLPTIIIGIIMCLLSAYFFVADRDQLNAVVRSHMPESMLYRYRLVKNSLLKAIGGYLKAQLKIEIWIYLLLVAGLFILQVDYTLLIALGIAFLDFLPIFGTGTVMLPWAVVKFLSADYKMTIGLLLLWGVSQLVRQIIQPKIVGDSIGVPPIPTLFLLYIGYMLAGVLGMIIAVPIGIILWTLYKEGALDTTKNSILILLAGMNHFRRLTPQDKSIIESYKRECEKELEEQQTAEEQRGKDA